MTEIVNNAIPKLILTISAITVLPSWTAPAADLRPLSTDRPDMTESPRTVDRGHFHIEMELAGWEKNGAESRWNFGEVTLKAGISVNTDLQLVLPIYSRGRGGQEEGFGDISLRLKHNLWGNDTGSTALGLLPWVSFPTGADGFGSDGLGGGVLVPFAFGLGGDWTAGLMPGFEIADSDSGSGEDLILIQSVVLGHPVSRTAAIFVEGAGFWNAGTGSGHEFWLNAGCTWTPGSGIYQWDAGLRFGLTRDTPDLMPFVGVSAKF